MKFSKFAFDGAFKIEFQKFQDTRGSFFELFKDYEFKKNIKFKFVQDNISVSKKNTLRGIHYQYKNPQGHLVTIIQGKIFDIGVDLRKKSKTFGKYASIILDDSNTTGVFWPPGVAHGFLALSSKNIISYKCTNYYSSKYEKGIKYNDEILKIKWPINKNNINISSKDLNNYDFLTVKQKYLPRL